MPSLNAVFRPGLRIAGPLFESLEPRLLLDGHPIISEFMAVNTSTLADEDGDYSDWIEVFNPSEGEVDLTGWHLTDDAGDLVGWTFPAVRLGPGEFLLVFASGKDRRDPKGRLHTDFRLNGGGEYLALVDNLGNVVQGYDPYPQQFADISYGIAQDVQTTRLVAAGATARYLVPSDGSLGTTWTSVAFTPGAGWKAGPTGLGYKASVSGFAVWNYKANTAVGNLNAALSVISNPSLRSATYSENVATVNYVNTGGGAHFASDRTFPGLTTGVEVDEFVVEARATITIPSTGYWSFGVNSDDGFSLDLTRSGASFHMEYPGLRGPTDTIQAFNITQAGDYDLRLVYYENGGGSEVELYAAKGNYAGWTASFRLVGDAGLGIAVRSQPVSGGGGGSGADFSNLIATSVLADMYSRNATLYARVPFTVADPAALGSLTLRMKYDDGYVAYLNGVEVARQYAPINPLWDSAATDWRTDAQATAWENVDLTGSLGVLQAGSNVLAIHALNYAAGDNDFLILPELVENVYTNLGEHFFAKASPGDFNGQDYWARVGDTKFSADRGFYDEPFDVAITCSTPQAEIYYTLDGSTPSATNGTRYTAPVRISRTTTLRAAAFRAGYSPSDTDTQTYIFLDDVIQQSPNGQAPGPGWPTGTVNGQTIDYGMDPDVVNDPRYAGTIKDDLKAVPTISLVTDLVNLFDPATGIYVNAGGDGEAWERSTSVELINPDGSKGFQIDAGLRIRGGFSRTGGNPKHAFRLMFSSKYGQASLNFPLFGDEGPDGFRNVDLRTTQNYSWAFQGDSRNTFLRDVFSRDMQREMGQPYTRSRYYHLYINGVYWGLYQTEERPEADYGATYFGGQAEDYDVIKVSPDAGYIAEATDGNIDAWTRLYNAAMTGFDANAAYFRVQGMNPDGTRNPAYERLVDVDNLIDYMISTIFVGDIDAPISNFLSNTRPNNFYAVYNRVNPDGFKYFRHDAEHTLDTGGADRTGPYPAGDQLQYFNPQFLHQKLCFNAEYRQRFADHVQRHFFNNGLLTPQTAKNLIQARKNQIDRAIVAESARWGDAKRHPAFTRDDHWVPAVNSILNYLNNRTSAVLGQLRNNRLYPGGTVAAPLYPNVDAPTFRINGSPQYGGTISPRDRLTITAPAGTIYYTLDGTDPRAIGGGLAPTAVPYAGQVELDGAQAVTARVLSGGTWSALAEATFAVDVAASLRITEIMYHPAAPTAAERAAGFIDPSDFEFLELTNIGAEPIDLEGVHFADGIDLTFSQVWVQPGGRVVVVRNRTAFELRYGAGTAQIAGEYPNSLADGGERIVLRTVLGEVIHDFTYSDDWYDQTDGDGFSLTVRQEGQALALWSSRDGWRPSQPFGGTPGAGDEFPVNPGDIVINEVLAHSNFAPNDWIELFDTTDHEIDIGGWFLSDDPGDLTKYQIPAGTKIQGGQYLVLTEDEHFGPGVAPSGFALSELGDDVILSSNAGGQAGGYREHVDFGASPPEMTFGRYVKTTGTRDFTLMSSPTPNELNAAPAVGPIVVNEVMYNPAAPAPGSPYTNEDFEFLELSNTTGQDQDLTQVCLRGGVGFTFGWYGADSFGSAVRTLQGGASAAWQASLPQAGDYDVFVWWDGADAQGDAMSLDPLAAYEVQHATGIAAVQVNQAYAGDWRRWVRLGTFSFDAGIATVRLTRGSDDPDAWTIADRIKFVPVGGGTEIVVDNADAGFSASRPTITSLAPGEYVVLVRNLAAFDHRYDIAGSGIPVAGVYSGNLGNGGDAVKLVQATNPEPNGFIPYVRIDHVNYEDDLPWPKEPDGTGASLSRVSATSYGNDAGNWSAGRLGGTPGAANIVIDTTPPTAPGDPQATITVTPALRIDLSWTPAQDPQSGVEFYTVYRDGQQIGTSAAPSYADTGVSPATPYSYQVTATNRDGYQGPASQTVLVTIPGIVSVSAPNRYSIRIVFSEAVQRSLAELLGNYQVAGVAISAAVLQGDNVTVDLVTSQLQPGQSYDLTISNMQTVSGRPMPPSLQRTFLYTPLGSGTILREYWTGISGTAVSDLTSNPSYPNNPTGTSQATIFEAPIDWNDSYGTRIRGYVHPPITGNYVFWISTDDNGALWLSTDEDPAHKVLIASVPGWSSSQEWTKFPAQQSAPIRLEAGKRYYIEALQKEEGGGDNLAVGWQLPDGTLERPIPGIRLSPWTGLPSDTTPPTTPGDLAATVISSTRIDLAWTASMDMESGVDHYVVYRNGAAVATTQATSYSDSGLDQGTTYAYQVSAVNTVSLESARSAVATANPWPGLSSAVVQDATHVLVTFGEAVEQTSAETVANYAITDGGGTAWTIAAALRQGDPAQVLLVLDQPLAKPASYTLTVSDVRDLTGGSIAPGSQATFMYSDVIADLLAWWTFDGDSGPVIPDASGRGHDLAVVQATWEAQGYIGGAVRFNGVTSYLIDDDGEDYVNGLTAFTIAMWVKAEIPAASADRAMFITRDAAADDWLSIRYDKLGSYGGKTNVLTFGLTTTADGACILETAANQQTLQWQHVVLTWWSAGSGGDGRMRAYLNGQYAPPSYITKTQLSGPITGAQNVKIGAGVGSPWKGLIDDVRIYGRALTAAEVAALANFEPQADDDAYAVDQLGVLTASAPGVLANDTDPDSGPQALTASLSAGPSHGALVLNADGSFVYTPADGFTGDDGFTYRAFDGYEYSGDAHVTLTIRPVTAPVTQDGSAATNEDTAVNGQAVARDAQGDPITYRLADGPAHGTLTFQPDGAFEYRPAADWSGQDSFTFIASDGQEDSKPGTVRITVRPVNDRPAAAAAQVRLAEDSPTEIVLSAADVETAAAGLIWTIVDSPQHGTLTRLAAGRYRYIPAAQYVGTDRFTFTVTDDGDPSGSGANPGPLTSLPAEVAITIDPANDRPVAYMQSVRLKSLDAVEIVLSGSDPETAAADLTYIIVTPPKYGCLTPLGGRRFRYEPGKDYVDGDRFTFAVTDTGDPAGSHANPGDLTSDPAAVVIASGIEQPLDAKGQYTFQDASGDWVTVILKGLGTGRLYFPFDGQCDVGRITVDSFSAKSSLTITTKGEGAETTVRQIVVNGSIASITAKTTDLISSLTVSERLGTLVLDDLVGPCALMIATGLPPEAIRANEAVTLTFDRVADASLSTHLPIKALTATEWVDGDGDGSAGGITAPWVGAITTKGAKVDLKAIPPDPGVPGDFSADLALSGEGLAAGKPAMGAAKIAGGIAQADWRIDGDVGAVSALGEIRGWTLQGADDGDGDALRTVKSLTLGDVQGAQVVVQDALGAVKALRWLGGRIEADSLASLGIAGRKPSKTAAGLDGDFTAAVLLRGLKVAPKKPALGSVTIAHDLTDSIWRIAGAIGKLTVTGTARGNTVSASGSIAGLILGCTDGSDFLAGVQTGKLDPDAVTQADLNVLATISSIQIKGLKLPDGTPIPRFVKDSNFLGASLGAVSLLNAEDGGYGLWVLEPNPGIKSVSHKDTDPAYAGNNWKWGPGKPLPSPWVGSSPIHAIPDGE